MDRKSLISSGRWQAPIVGLLGAWLAVSPWVLGPAESESVIAFHLVLGLALLAAAGAMVHAKLGAWGGWLAVGAGLLTAAAPWLLGYLGQASATNATNAIGVGVASAVLGFWVVLMSTDPESWWNDRVAH
jgi:hypothetical protein